MEGVVDKVPLGRDSCGRAPQEGSKFHQAVVQQEDALMDQKNKSPREESLIVDVLTWGMVCLIVFGVMGLIDGKLNNRVYASKPSFALYQPSASSHMPAMLSLASWR